MIQILMVEDVDQERGGLRTGLTRENLKVDAVPSEQALLSTLRDGLYDIIVIDCDVTGVDGWSVARTIRDRHNVGIILVGNFDCPEDRIRGFASGADHSFVKPVDARELAAAILALTRRLKGRAAPSPARTSFEAGPRAEHDARTWVFDLTRWTLTAPEGVSVFLTSTEVRFLEVLLQYPGALVARADLLSAMRYQNTDSGNRNLEALVRRLRRKVEEATQARSTIQTVHRQGYLFSAPVRIERP
ncbi:response regulator transcription factor [Pararhodospirillum oryzae]|uniref:Transcriptional regulator n=1 Tax=Pararhodospirillum oryzae TaxID=478448 RepID=A0A512HC05_9PROT|nr:response regulator transcription factor [Pararhodospirillum oryzae]GEO82982.1 transcriptional regulator [Pararhodospirillum oryzae]